MTAAFSCGRAAGDARSAAASARPSVGRATSRVASAAPRRRPRSPASAAEIESSSSPSSPDDHERALGAEQRERPGDRLQVGAGRRRRSAAALAPAGLVSGPSKLKIVRTAELLAHRDHVARRLVVGGGEHEAEADLVDAARRRRRGRGRCAPRAPRAGRPSRERLVAERLPCLATGAAGAGGDQRRGGGDVEGARARRRCRRCRARSAAGGLHVARRARASCAPGRPAPARSRPSCAARSGSRRSASRRRRRA